MNRRSFLARLGLVAVAPSILLSLSPAPKEPARLTTKQLQEIMRHLQRTTKAVWEGRIRGEYARLAAIS